ncbi:MAG: calcium-binding EGF-like domain-containing protein [Deltaproteobacteria bacterium]|nr:calcium-binding EGF-like domain-containing protein [Deltaproteobacteria bacterium]
MNVDDCAPNPCLNGGTCTDGINAFTCTCAAGFSGATCATAVNPCFPNPCTFGGTCMASGNGYTCTLGGAGGCGVNNNNRQCKNYSTCVDVPASNGFMCQYQAGTTGSPCEIDVVECAANPCQNGATC